MGVHAKGHCGKYRIQTKYTFNRCQQVHIIDSMHTKTLALQKTKRFVVFVCGIYR